MNSLKSAPQRRFRKRWLILLAVSVLTGGLLLQHWSTQEPLPEMTTLQRGDIESSVLASGTLRPKNLVAIGAQATGRILSLKVKPGQHVKGVTSSRSSMRPTSRTNSTRPKRLYARTKQPESRTLLIWNWQN